jgi:hypothetical protein
VHSCGDCSRVVSAMLEIPGLRGLELTMPQNTRWELIQPAVGRVALCLRHKFSDSALQDYEPVDFTRRLLDTFGRRGVFILTSRPTFDEARALGEKLWPLLVG